MSPGLFNQPQSLFTHGFSDNRLLMQLFAVAPLGIGIIDKQLHYCEVNQELADINGCAIEAHRGRHIREVIPTLASTIEPLLLQVLTTGEEFVELPLSGYTAAHGGSSRHWLATYSPLLNERGEPNGILAIVQDITAQHLDRDAVNSSEERFRQVVEAAPDGLAMVDENGLLVLVNAGLERMFGYRREEMIGHPIEFLMPERYRGGHLERRNHFLRAPEARDMAGRKELYARRKDGSEFPVEIGLNPLQAADRLHVLATIQDVTKRKADQAMLEKALQEKTALLNEVHHRVKNNLQVVSSLLNLQTRHASPEASQLLSESQGRVKAIALIHQLLYERNDYAQVELGLYLQRLARLQSETFQSHSDRIRLHIQQPDHPITLDLQRAVPCGLLVNELISNAFKHAFPNEQRGTICITLSPCEDGCFITVRDDGIGLPSDIHLGETLTLGFQLLPLLTEQAGGHLSIEPCERGCHFLLSLPHIA